MDSSKFKLVNPLPVRPALPSIALPSIALTPPLATPPSADMETLKMMHYHVQNLQSLMTACFLEGKLAPYNGCFLQYHIAGLSSLLELHNSCAIAARPTPPAPTPPAPQHRDPLLFVREVPPFKRVRVNKLRGPCKHCSIKHSPEWRKGPAGEKTLCNACGIHYQKWNALPTLVSTGPPPTLPAAATHDVEVINE